MTTPPGNLPRYRLLTGPDDETFCRCVSEALAKGFELYGSPAATFNGKEVIVAQALLWPSPQQNAANVGTWARPLASRRSTRIARRNWCGW